MTTTTKVDDLTKKIGKLIAEEQAEVNDALRALHIVALYIIEESEKIEDEEQGKN